MATFPHEYVSKSKECIISIDGFDYDVSAWRGSHPGGAELLDQMHGMDATDAFYALHSKEAIAKLQRMAKKPTDMSKAAFKVSPVAKAFREFRKRLEKEGWFERNWMIEAFYSGLVLTFAAIGTLIARSHPVIASLLIGVAI